MKSLDSWSDLPPDPHAPPPPPPRPPLPTPPPPMGQTWGHKIADLVFLPLSSFILAFRVLECIKRYWKPYVMSLDSWLDLPPDHPL